MCKYVQLMRIDLEMEANIYRTYIHFRVGGEPRHDVDDVWDLGMLHRKYCRRRGAENKGMNT